MAIIDTLSARLAEVRTWTFIANRSGWLRDPAHWQGAARRVEDNLSDALHERLAQRFVDRRTSVLMRRLRENAMLEAEVPRAGDVLVEGQHVGQLKDFASRPTRRRRAKPQGAERRRTKSARRAKSRAARDASRAKPSTKLSCLPATA